MICLTRKEKICGKVYYFSLLSSSMLGCCTTYTAHSIDVRVAVLIYVVIIIHSVSDDGRYYISAPIF